MSTLLSDVVAVYQFLVSHKAAIASVLAALAATAGLPYQYAAILQDLALILGGTAAIQYGAPHVAQAILDRSGG